MDMGLITQLCELLCMSLVTIVHVVLPLVVIATWHSISSSEEIVQEEAYKR